MRAPPRARGSTLPLFRLDRARGGSPACAGIDRNHREDRHRDPGLPRVRGDRPFVRTQLRTIIAAPPRARGSTSPYPF